MYFFVVVVVFLVLVLWLRSSFVCVHDSREAVALLWLCRCAGLTARWQRRSQNAEKVTHIKGRLLDQAMILFNCVPFQMGPSLKGKNLLSEGANSFLYEQVPIVWKITFITISDLPWMLLFLLHSCVTSLTGAMPMADVIYKYQNFLSIYCLTLCIMEMCLITISKQQ